ncbi:polyA+ RNA export [Coprinopsis marcescibilis]|uniref:PolyA+ RNA export n=1 Tax=Coprinopsis marcescibilis TaxID=230819 RepID=A0A5C3L5W6_COPMA|nr:polyA+ RNA export [Coprinopsis marcescibilis]
MAFFSGGAPQIATSATNSAEKDVEISDPPSDSISSIAFSPQADYLGVASWDNSVRIYEIGPQGQSQGKAMYQHPGPVLDVCWNADGTKLFSGGADNAARMFDTTTGQSTQVAQHEASVKCVAWVNTPQAGILATGSWDKTVKYWDLRTQAPVATVQLPERCYALDVQYPWLVVGTAERHIKVFDLNNPTVPFKDLMSPLKWQTRTLSCFSLPSGGGYAVGSVEGRVAIHFIDDKNSQGNFSFRCHRRDSVPNSKDQSLIYAVNAMAYHPVQGTLATAGSDGTMHFWDTEARTRLKSFDPTVAPVTSVAFNRTGDLFAYAASYDWSKGHSSMVPGTPNKLMLHKCRDEEVRKRLKK